MSLCFQLILQESCTSVEYLETHLCPLFPRKKQNNFIKLCRAEVIAIRKLGFFSGILLCYITQRQDLCSLRIILQVACHFIHSINLLPKLSQSSPVHYKHKIVMSSREQAGRLDRILSTKSLKQFVYLQ